MKRVLLLGAAACALALAGLLPAVSDAPAPSRAPTAHPAPPPAAAARPSRARTPRPMPAVPRLPEPPSVDDYERDLVVEDGALADAFERQPVDATWAATARDRVEARLAALLVDTDTTVTSTECRSTGCRVELALAGDRDPMAIAGQLAGTNYELGCSTRIRLSEPTAAAEPARAVLHLHDCRR